MPRRLRVSTGGYAYHVLNRGVGRKRIFAKQRDFEAFEEVIAQAKARLPMRVLAWCVMPNHWHFVLWPRGDGDLSEFMRWLTVTHTQRWHAAHGTSGTGPLYQGRFKSFPIQEDDHLLDGAALRGAKSAAREAGPKRRMPGDGRAFGIAGMATQLDSWTTGRWNCRVVGYQHVQTPQTEAELEALRRSVVRGSPFGEASWQEQTAKRLGLQSTLRPRGRPWPKTNQNKDSRPP